MKRPRWKTLVLFVLPFLLLAAVTLRLEGTLRLDKDSALFAQEVTRKIPSGMPLRRAEDFLKNNGFSTGAAHSNLKQIGLAQLGKAAPPVSSPVKEIGFTKIHVAFPRILDKHIWRVWISVRDGRVQRAEGSYNYDRFD